MKYIITENKLKSFLKKKLDFDLTDKISLVQSWVDLPGNFSNRLNKSLLNHYLNQYGPMFLFDLPQGLFLAQDWRKDGWMIVDHKDEPIRESDFMDMFGIRQLGISMDDLIKYYSPEE